jgi:hypothetical protein
LRRAAHPGEGAPDPSSVGAAAKWAATAAAARRFIPGARASSSIEAAAIAATVPKWRSRAERRVLPMPAMSSRVLRSAALPRRSRWKVLAKRWASSRSRARRNSSAVLGAERQRLLDPAHEHAVGQIAGRHRPLLGQGDHVEHRVVAVERDPEIAQRRHRHPELALAAVDHQQVGRRPGVVVAGGARLNRRDSTSYIDAKSSLPAVLTLKVR